MKPFSDKRGRVIDFEGSRTKGIQQASLIDFENFEIVHSSEYLRKDGSFNDWVLDNAQQIKIDFWVAHNANVERNLLQEFVPYNVKQSSRDGSIQWGPWLDTLVIYRNLYPKLNKFSLDNLHAQFLENKEVRKITEKLCEKTLPKHHNSMYDCIITFLLLKRLNKYIDLRSFMN